jgi:hypothetical protein
MARAPKAMTDDETDVKSVTESVTYLPGNGDPSTVTWCGHTFRANVPKEITGDPNGSQREQLNHHLIERARENKHFSVGSARPKKRDALVMPQAAEEYRAYMVGWLQDPEIQHADQLIARFAKDRDLQIACEVGADDYNYLATLFMPKLHDLAKGDELTEGQVSSLWINHGINQLPW